MKEIITENYIDEDAARAFLASGYADFDLFPGIPDGKLTDTDIASLLGVSVPTVVRMRQNNELQPTKASIKEYIFAHLTVNLPLLEP